MATCYYCVKDPIENFNLNVVVRESSRLVIREDSSNDAVFHEDVSISWQEKIDGPADIIKNFRKNDSSPSDRSSRDELKNVMLYTYIDKDQYRISKLPALVDPSVEESYLGAAMHRNPADSGSGRVSSDREAKLLTRITRGETFKSMHICLATDVTTTATAKGHSSHMALKDMKEHVLCSIKLYQNGLLEVTPGLSGPVSETEGVFLESKGLASNRVAMSAFLDDNSVERALASGFKLSTSSVRSKNGVEYEYCIQNVNDLLVPYQLEEIFKRQNLLDMRAHTLNKCSAENTNWTQDPAAPGRQKIYTIYAEIVSGENFTGKKIYLNYQVQVPLGWDLRTGNVNDGVSEKYVGGMSAQRIGLSSSGNSSGLNGRGGDGFGIGIGIGSNRAGEGVIGLSGADVLALDAYSDGIDAQGMLRGTTHTATSQDSKHHSRRKYVTYALEQGARIFLGSSFFIITVISIILGLSYPFWLVPALVIIFTLGTGIPAGGVEIVPAPDTKKYLNSSSKFSVKATRADDKISEKDREQEKEKQRLREKQRRNSVTQSQNASLRHLRTPLINPSTAHFNHLINLSFDVKDVTVEPHTHANAHIHTPTHAHTPGVFQDTPTIHFQVYSVTGMGRQILEGYGIFKIQAGPGSVDTTVRTWRPQGDLNSKMKEHFLGTAVRFKNSNFAEVPKHCSVLNRFGMFSENVGSLRLRCNVLVTDARTAVMKHKAPAAEQESNVRRRTVDDILLAFKATGTLRKSLGDTSAVGQGSLASRLHAIRSSLDGDVGGIGETRSKGDRVAEILSRVRTLTKKLDTPINVRDAAAVSTPITASRGIGIGIAAPSSSSRYADNKSDSMGGDSRDEAVWSLVNPMHANPKSRVGTPAERGVGGVGGRGRARGEERGAVLKLSKPHRYSNSSGVEEETGSDEGAEKKHDDGISSNSSNRSSRQQVEGDRGRSLKEDTDEREDKGADEKATSRPTRAEGCASKDDVQHLGEKRDD